jgi:signal transduction histidine kinase/CheY-like chemotaxis protein
VRTPLQAVSGAVALLSATQLAPQQLELLRLLDEGASQLTRVITDVMEYDALVQGTSGYSSAAAAAAAAASAAAAACSLVELETEVLAPAVALSGLPDASAARLLARNVTLRRAAGRGVPAALLGDAPALRRVVTNLVANALKYSPDDGTGVVTLTVERCDPPSFGDVDAATDAALTAPLDARPLPPPPPSRAHARGAHLRITVADNGVGLAASRLTSCFAPLSAADDAARHEHGGAGLGLAICRRLALGMGATLVARSEGVGWGAAFSLTLPLVTPPAAPAYTSADAATPPRAAARAAPRGGDGGGGGAKQAQQAPDEAPVLAVPGAPARCSLCPSLSMLSLASLGSSDSSPPESPETGRAAAAAAAAVAAAVTPSPWTRADGSPLRVLLAEDNALCAAVVMRMLSRTGAVVTLVPDGVEAVRLVSATGADFDLVVLDLEMPRMDGVEAALAIRALAEERGRAVPTVALSANCSRAARERCTQAGMVAHLTKPLRIEHLPGLRLHAAC